MATKRGVIAPIPESAYPDPAPGLAARSLPPVITTSRERNSLTVDKGDLLEVKVIGPNDEVWELVAFKSPVWGVDGKERCQELSGSWKMAERHKLRAFAASGSMETAFAEKTISIFGSSESAEAVGGLWLFDQRSLTFKLTLPLDSYGYLICESSNDVVL